MPTNLPKWIAGFALVLLAAAPSGLADTEFRARRMTRGDVPLGKGQCDIRLRIDGEAEVSVRGDMVHIRTISGRDGRDDGSECNEPLPARSLGGFDFEVRDRRGDIALLSEPTPRSDYRAVVRIRDSEGGEGRYHFRLSWQMDGGVSGPGARPDNRPRDVFGDARRGTPDNRGRAASIGSAVDACANAVSSRIADQYRSGGVDILSLRADSERGGYYLEGEAEAGGGRAAERFTFSCQVDGNNGRVRNVDVRRR